MTDWDEAEPVGEELVLTVPPEAAGERLDKALAAAVLFGIDQVFNDLGPGHGCSTSRPSCQTR